MVLMAYLAGIMTPVALVVGVVSGHAWWAALRRSEGASGTGLRLTVAPPPPPPPLAQDRPRVNRVSYANSPGPRRSVRSKPPRTG